MEAARGGAPRRLPPQQLHDSPPQRPQLPPLVLLVKPLPREGGSPGQSRKYLRALLWFNMWPQGETAAHGTVELDVYGTAEQCKGE